jgi:hypothetical protein
LAIGPSRSGRSVRRFCRAWAPWCLTDPIGAWVPKAATVVPAQDAFRGMAFARNEHGGWSLSIRETLDSAREESLKSCNERRADCRIELTISPSRFACLAIAKKPNLGMPVPAASGSLAASRRAALTACKSANGMGCVLVYSGCND